MWADGKGESTSPLSWRCKPVANEPHLGNIYDAVGNRVLGLIPIETASRICLAVNRNEVFNEMREALQEFVDRVDAGEVRSRYTYKLFKSILAKLKAAESDNR